MKGKFFDINRIPGQGILVFPLSMSRLSTAQNPQLIYSFLQKFESKVTEKTVDVVFVYTNGLYSNSHNESYEVRKKLIAQMITHKRELLTIIKKDNQFSVSAIHFICWDDLILQTNNYLELFATLLKIYNTDNFFKSLVRSESRGKEITTAQIDFILEETILTYLIRQKLVTLPFTLSNQNGWRLICYAGHCLTTDVYLYQKNLLPTNYKIIHQDFFSEKTASAMYNITEGYLELYDDVDLNFYSTLFLNEVSL